MPLATYIAYIRPRSTGTGRAPTPLPLIDTLTFGLRPSELYPPEEAREYQLPVVWTSGGGNGTASDMPRMNEIPYD